MVKNPNWQEADQLAIYKRGRGVELGATEKQLQLAVRAGLEPGTSGFQVRRPNHSATLPPTFTRIVFCLQWILEQIIYIYTALDLYVALSDYIADYSSDYMFTTFAVGRTYVT